MQILPMSEKYKMADGTSRGLCVSHSTFNEADFSGRGRVISGRLRTDLKVWNEHKIIAWSLGPMKTANNYLNTVSVDVVSLCMRNLQKRCPPTVPTRKALSCCNSLPACEASFLTRKEYAVCSIALNTISDRNKTET